MVADPVLTRVRGDHQMKAKLTPAFVAGASTEAERMTWWDEGLSGFGLMVTRKGHKSWVVQYRAGGRSRRLHLKTTLTLTEARREARALLGSVARGGDPLIERRKVERAKENTLAAITQEWIDKAGVHLRALKERERVLRTLVLPKLGDRQIEDISRLDIVRMLDQIAVENGPVASDNALAYLRKIMNWHATRSEFRSPIVAGMARSNPAKRRRQRILSDDEIRALWTAAEAHPSAFARFVQFVLLTATRRSEAAAMRRSEVTGDEWIIPEQRYKTGLQLLVPLSPATRAVFDKVPKVSASGLVFTTDGKAPISGFSQFKAQFDALMLTELRRQNPEAVMPRWTIHDLRRTARSLMSRAGVPTDHAERCLGHVMGAIRGTYDRYEYRTEKQRAFEALAALLERIINPAAGNVRQLRAG
jgi:integrase